MKILVDNKPLDLYSGFSMEIEDASPVFNDEGSQTLAFSLPSTSHNRRLLGFPARPDLTANGKPRRFTCTVISGTYIRTGILNITGATDSDISINIGFDNAVAYQAWKSKRLSELNSLPCLKFKDLSTLIEKMKDLYSYSNPLKDDLAVFSICVGMESAKDIGDKEHDYYEILSPIALYVANGNGTLKVIRVIDGERTEVSVPDGYGCVPFVRVWKILECIFKELGLAIDSNPFKSNLELARLVVLNNTADALCTGILDYCELMPDCTIEEFLNALFVRFGMVYRTDFDRGTVSIRLMKDIVAESPQMDLDEYLCQMPESEYQTPQYVKLSAGVSLEGAEPLTSRFEDFMQGFSVKNVYCGQSIYEWGTRAPLEVNEELEDWPFIEEPSYGGPSGKPSFPFDPRLPSTDPGPIGPGPTADPDPDVPVDPEPPDPDAPDFVEIARSEKPSSQGCQFTWDAITGRWYRVSTLNGNRISEESTSFFDWDPKPEGYDPWDLESADDSCPIGVAQENTTLENASAYVVMPLFYTGSRHFHTYVDSLEKEENGDCPLSFMFASPGIGDSKKGTAGRLSCGISLYFQFRKGLYDTFWRKYDLAHRNADRKVKVKCRMRNTSLLDIDMLRPVKLHGVPMLIDRINTTVGDDSFTIAEITLIPMVGGLDAFEVPDFPPTGSVR